ncbi:MAG: SDR family NAD(P)-dependent oxidoreductase [Blastopirellula sp. JB062]
MTLPALFDLTGRNVLVTGGSKGIGKTIARALSEAGANVCITSRNMQELSAARNEILGDREAIVACFVCDMADRSAVDAMAEWVLEEFGRVDILFNNAGTNQPQSLLETTDESWDRVLEINFTSCMRLARKLAPGMIENGWGRIIHLSSVLAVASNPGRGNYSGTKGALSAMTRAHALELGPHGVTVNCLAPGPIATDLTMGLLDAEQKKRFAARTALLRWGETRDLIGPALLLASDAGAYITGTTLLVEGGMICRTFD